MLICETERLFLRDWVHDDWKRYKPLATDPRVLKYIGDGKPLTDEQIRTRIDRLIELSATRGWNLWPVIHREQSELIGFCGFWDGFLPEVEIGWRLVPDSWGQGIATEAARAVMEYGFKRWQFSHLISVARVENQASIRVMEKLGMEFERTFLYQGFETVRYTLPNPQFHESGSKKLSIRPYQDSDLLEVVRLWGIVFPNPPAWNDPAEDIRRKLSVQRELFLVGEVEGRIVATTMAGFDGHRGWLYLVAVHPEHRKQGIGRALMNETEQRIRELGCTKVNLQVRATNQGVVKFYESLGYAIEDRVSMGKRLDY